MLSLPAQVKLYKTYNEASPLLEKENDSRKISTKIFFVALSIFSISIISTIVLNYKFPDSKLITPITYVSWTSGIIGIMACVVGNSRDYDPYDSSYGEAAGNL